MNLPRPECPKELLDNFPEAKEKWDWTCDRMEEAGLPFAAAVVPLFNFVATLLTYCKELSLAAKGGTVAIHTTGDGRKEVRINPHFRTMRQLRSDLARYSKDLGLDPSARARVLSMIGGGKPDEKRTDLAVRKRER